MNLNHNQEKKDQQTPLDRDSQLADAALHLHSQGGAVNSLDHDPEISNAPNELTIKPSPHVRHTVGLSISKKWAGLIITIAGLCGMAFFTSRMPDDNNDVFLTAKWSFGMTASTIVAFAGLPGVYYSRLKSNHLKVIDLIWVLASAVAVAFALVQISQLSANDERRNLKQNIEKAHVDAQENSIFAFQQLCLHPSDLSGKQCEALRSLAISLKYNNYSSPTIINALCPHPINLEKPPKGFSREVVETCINASYVNFASNAQVFKDKENVDEWNMATRMWPHLMIFLVALRVMKSIAEVFWRVK